MWEAELMFSVRRWRQSRRRDRQVDTDLKFLAVAKQEQRARLMGREEELQWLEQVLFDADPIGLDFEENADEYRPEAEMILLRLGTPLSKNEVRTLVHSVFVDWFDPQMAGPPERYEGVAQTIWHRYGPAAVADAPTP